MDGKNGPLINVISIDSLAIACGELPIYLNPGSACDDNIRYGILFARQYLDSPQNTHSPPGVSVHRTKEELIRSAVNIHNNNAGRQVAINIWLHLTAWENTEITVR